MKMRKEETNEKQKMLLQVGHNNMHATVNQTKPSTKVEIMSIGNKC